MTYWYLFGVSFKVIFLVVKLSFLAQVFSENKLIATLVDNLVNTFDKALAGS